MYVRENAGWEVYTLYETDKVAFVDMVTGGRGGLSVTKSTPRGITLHVDHVWRSHSRCVQVSQGFSCRNLSVLDENLQPDVNTLRCGLFTIPPVLLLHLHSHAAQTEFTVSFLYLCPLFVHKFKASMCSGVHMTGINSLCCHQRIIMCRQS